VTGHERTAAAATGSTAEVGKSAVAVAGLMLASCKVAGRLQRVAVQLPSDVDALLAILTTLVQIEEGDGPC